MLVSRAQKRALDFWATLRAIALVLCLERLGSKLLLFTKRKLVALVRGSLRRGGEQDCSAVRFQSIVPYKPVDAWRAQRCIDASAFLAVIGHGRPPLLKASW